MKDLAATEGEVIVIKQVQHQVCECNFKHVSRNRVLRHYAVQEYQQVGWADCYYWNVLSVVLVWQVDSCTEEADLFSEIIPILLCDLYLV